MKNIYLLIVLILFFFSSCKKESSITNPPPNQEQGQVFLKLDRENIPENVMIVSAFLTRTGYDTIKKQLNVLTDTSAEITIQNIVVGTWKLKINAYDNQNIVVYTGETNVNIVANMITQVQLTLMPTGNGVGSIHIYVRWGETNLSQWVDYVNNPILFSNNSFYEIKGVGNPRVLSSNNTYEMWFTSYSLNNSYVLYATSNDANNWIRVSQIPVLTPGISNSWDDVFVSAGPVIKDASGYKMYYYGYSNTTKGQIGLAYSLNGLNWNKHSIPVLNNQSSGWEYNIDACDVLKVNNIYYMFYHGTSGEVNYQIKIGVATSTDGINWTKFSGNPILQKSQQWEGNGVSFGSVIYEDNQFKMVYSSKSGQTSGFGLAYSNDGFSWTKDNHNPIFTNYMTYNNWGRNEISYPFFRKIGNEYRIYYTAFDSLSNQRKIGFTRKIQ